MRDKKNIIILGLAVLLAVSVAFNISTEESLKEVASKESPQGEQLTSENLFQKKQDCAIYKKQIEDKFEKNNNGEIPIEYYYLDEVFYSPKANSCMYTYSGMFGLKASDRYRTLYLADALSGALIFQATVISEGKFDGPAQSNFYDFVNTFK